MYFAHTALAAACFVVLVNGEDEKHVTQDSKYKINFRKKRGEEADAHLIDNHTFIALVDIAFKDKTQRTCTGTIIHENVVITAAHCFKNNNNDAKAELTASFIVIGTKTMFDSGYEQYLPIERVVTHPHYKGWTADLSLVYTFAGMISDKPGTVIPLAGDKTSTHVDSNVTVLSWGSVIGFDLISDVNVSSTRNYDAGVDEDSCSSNEQESDSQMDNKRPYRSRKKKVTATLQRPRLKAYNDEQDSNSEMDTERPYHGSHKKKSSFHKQERKLITHKHQKNRVHQHRNDKRNELPVKRIYNTNTRQKIGKLKNKAKERKTTKIISRYLTESEESIEKENLATSFYTASKEIKTTENEIFHRYHIDKSPVTKPSLEQLKDDQTERQGPNPKTLNVSSYYKNWRRNMGAQQNQLTVENFGFVNMQSCKNLVEKSMPSEYDISKHNDAICYASGDRFINDDDSGAPAIRQGQLVAVTIGGAECDGDHVAIGMKMSCYCSWIADNLPNNDGNRLNCCQNCCDIKHKEEIKSDKRYRFRNTFLV